MRRVVVTGLGLVTPLACGVEETWSRILDGQSGAGTITKFDPENVSAIRPSRVGQRADPTRSRNACASGPVTRNFA